MVRQQSPSISSQFQLWPVSQTQMARSNKQGQVIYKTMSSTDCLLQAMASHAQPHPKSSKSASLLPDKPWTESLVQPGMGSHSGQPGPAMGSKVQQSLARQARSSHGQQSPATNMKHLQHCTTRSNQVWQPDKPWTAGQTQTHLALSRPGYGSIQPWAARPSNGHQIQPWKGPVMSSQIQPWAARPTWPGSAMTSQQWSGSKVLQYPASSNYGQ